MNYLVMSGNTVVAEYIDGQLTIINDKLSPIYLKRTGNLEHWLETRAIDYHRANSRLLKKALRLDERNDLSASLKVNAVTITDNYWVKPVGSSLNYEDVQFDNDYFANLALLGDYDSFNRAVKNNNERTPELTNTGSFEKCWKLKNNQWWLYKSANHNEQFSEIFICRFGKLLGFNMAEYIRGEKCVMTQDFTDNARYNFEPAYSFMDDNENYIDVIKTLEKIAPHIIPEYINLVFMDTIIANPDRHTFNFGILRNTETGDIISLAPNFDNNMALISRGYPKNISRKNDAFVTFFNEIKNYRPELMDNLPLVTSEIIENAISDVNMRVRTRTVIDFIINGYQQLNLKS